MKKKSELTASYNSARSNMMVMLVLTAVNVVLTLFDAGVMFLFTAYFPYIAAVYANGLLSFIKPLVIIVGVILPLLVTLLCWIFTGKGKYRWMNFAAVIFALDTVFMLVMFINRGFQAELVSNYIVGTLFHVFILFALFRGASAGKKLQKGEFVDDTNDVIVVAGSEADAVASAANADQAAIPVSRKYVYNKEYAKSKGADKTTIAVLTVVGFIVLTFVLLAINGAVFVFGFLAALAAMIAIFTRINPFTQARAASYIADPQGKLSCSMNQGFAAASVELNDMKIVDTRDDRWVVEYSDAKGKTKKLTIPNAYPGLEDYMNGVK